MRTVLKLSFTNMQKLLSVRKVLTPIVVKNQAKQDNHNFYDDMDEYAEIYVLD
jgi:hypothetical protein